MKQIRRTFAIRLSAVRLHTIGCTSLLGCALVLTMVACNHSSREQETVFSYECEVNGRQTGKKTFSNKEDYCRALSEDLENGGCAANMHYQTYESQCKGILSEQAEKDASEMTEMTKTTQPGRPHTQTPAEETRSRGPHAPRPPNAIDSHLPPSSAKVGSPKSLTLFASPRSPLELKTKQTADGLLMSTLDGRLVVDSVVASVDSEDLTHAVSSPDSAHSQNSRESLDSRDSLDANNSKGIVPENLVLHLMRVQSLDLLEPALENCTLTVRQFTNTDADKSIGMTLIGLDTAAQLATGCRTKLQQMVWNGLTVRFQNVPVGGPLNRELIETVVLKVKPNKPQRQG